MIVIHRDVKYGLKSWPETSLSFRSKIRTMYAMMKLSVKNVRINVVFADSLNLHLTENVRLDEQPFRAHTLCARGLVNLLVEKIVRMIA